MFFFDLSPWWTVNVSQVNLSSFQLLLGEQINHFPPRNSSVIEPQVEQWDVFEFVTSRSDDDANAFCPLTRA